jgi:Holliday junction resolvase RusA-like endonuclease
VGVTIIIKGEPASKANSRKLVTNRRTGRPMFVKSDKARAYVAGVERQVRRLDPLMTGPLVATITIWYASERPDLDEALILDALQGRLYVNDRQVREKHIYHRIDRADPRAEVRIKPLQGDMLAGAA